MSMPPQFFTSLAGVPVRYDRENPGQYGTHGVPFRFHCVPGFTAKLEAFFEELWRVCPLGRAEVITSAGAYTNKAGRHGMGRAFDIDAIFWAERTFVTLHDGFEGRDRAFYFGVECVLRKHFGQVLDYLYNAAHRDHFHVDDAEEVGFREGSESTVGFLQATLRHVHGLRVGINGTWGPGTREATRRALRSMGISGMIYDRDTWLAFLTRSAARAFGTEASPGTAAPGAETEERTPDALLHGVYEAIRRELGETALREPVERALDRFVTHPETIAWLRSGAAAPTPSAALPPIRVAPDPAAPVLDPVGADGGSGR